MNLKEKAAVIILKISKKFGCGKNNVKRLFKGAVPFALSAAVLFAAFSIFSGYTLAYEVDIEGQTVGYIADRAQLDDLLSTLDSKTVSSDITISDITSCQAKYVTSDSISDVSDHTQQHYFGLFQPFRRRGTLYRR